MSRHYSDDDAYLPEEELSETARRSGQTSVRRTVRSGSSAQNRQAADQHRARGGMYDIDAIFDAQAQPEESYVSRLQAFEKGHRAHRSRAGSGRRARSGADEGAIVDAPSESDTQERRTTSRARGTYDRSRYSTAAATSGGGSKKKIILIVVIVVVVAAIAGAVGYCSMINSNLHEGVDEDLKAALVQTDMAKEPFYILLMGTDASEEREESAEYGGGGYRSDSIMLARIDAPNKKAALISIHRDTKTDMEEHGIQKLNAAHAIGGPALAVEEVSEMAGVPISHYAEIDFDGFCQMVDALGGIEVDVPVEIDDYEAGGLLHAGLQTLNGDQALILCRSRHTYESTAADPDMMRAANQRLVLSAIARKVLNSDVATIANAVGQMSSYVMTDLDVNDIIGLAQAMQGLDPETDIYSAMEPVDAVYEDGVAYTITREDEWREMIKRMDSGLPPLESGLVDEKTGTILATAGGDFADTEKICWISVKNGTPKEGLATSAVSLLNAAGFVNAAASSANTDDYTETLVIYDDAAQEYEAQQIVAALGQGKAMKNDGDWIYDGDFLVIIGSDWNPNKGGSSSAASGSSAAGSGAAASSAAADTSANATRNG